MGNFIGFLLIGGAAVLIIYLGVGIVRDLLKRKKNKHDENNEKYVDFYVYHIHYYSSKPL